MGWLLGCFKCRQRRRSCSSLNLSAKCKEQNKIVLNAVPWNANFTQTQATSQGEQVDFNLCPEKCEVERDVPTQSNDLDKSLAVSINTEKRRFWATKHSSDQLLQVEKLEEELNNLRRRLVEEANEAKNLRNEVRYLQNCGELLDSPDAFKKALDDLQRASKEGQVEESGHLLLLQSLLTKIESEGGALVEPCSEKKEKNRSPSSDAKIRAHIEIIEAPEDLLESIDTSSLVTWTESESSLENLHGKTVVTGPDHSQSTKVLNSLNSQSASSEGWGHSSDAEQKLLNTRLGSPSDYVILDAKQPQLIPVTRRRRSTSLSFSGLFLVEDEVGNRFTSEQFPIEGSNSTESQGLKPSTKILEETDLSSENIDEASKSLFAFATDAPQSRSVSAGQVISLNVSRDDIFSNTDSEVNSHSVDPYANDSCFTLHQQRPSRGPSSPKDHSAHEVQFPCANTSMEQSQVGTSEDSYDGFSDISPHISAHHSSKRNGIDDFLDGGKLDSDQMSEVSDASSSKTLPQLHVYSVEDKASAKKITNPHATVRASTMSQEENAILWKKMSSECSRSTEVQAERVPSKEDYPVLSQQHWSAASTNTIERWISRTTGFELKNSHESLNSEIQILIETFEETNSKKASLSGGLKQSSSDMLGQNKLLVSELSGEGTFKQELTPSRTRTVTSPDISILPSLQHVQIPELEGQGIAREQLPAPGATSSLTLDSKMPPYTIHTQSSLLHVTAKQGLTPHRPTSNLPTEILTMPNSVHSQLPVPSLSDEGTSKQQLTPSRTLLASTAQVETPNCIQSQGSPAKLAEDRPILGTVAAHWSHSSSTQKWWDGKGIPNSTNKYKEDQKVSWHATPFEVRLERALAKQGRVLQKKLFAGAMATEMEVSTGPITSPS